METQTKKLDIEEILAWQAAEDFQIRDFDCTEILFDLCALKRVPIKRTRSPFLSFRRTNGHPYNFNITDGVSNHLKKYQGLVPWHSFLYNNVTIINPDVDNKRIEKIEDANEIASKRAGKRFRRLGIVDIKIISRAFDRAEQGSQTLIVSDDDGLRRTVDYLREIEDFLRKEIYAFGLRGIVSKLYPQINPKQFPYYVN